MLEKVITSQVDYNLKFSQAEDLKVTSRLTCKENHYNILSKESSKDKHVLVLLFLTLYYDEGHNIKESWAGRK